MMRRGGKVLFVVLAWVLMALPAVGLLRGNAPQDGEVADAYVERSIAFRAPLIELHAAVAEAFFGESGNAQVVLGRDGWLYFVETMEDYFRRGSMTDAQIEIVADKLQAVSERLAAEGIGFTFLCAPNKNSVYPQWMPIYARMGTGESNLLRLQTALWERGVDVCDAYAVLTEAAADGAQLYHRTDTHWNAQGALLVYRALMAQVADSYAAFDDVMWMASPMLGDLTALYRPMATESETVLTPDIARTYAVRGTMRSVSDMRIETVGEDPDAPHMLVLRDSFGDALFPYLANATASVQYVRATPYDLMPALEGDIDHVVLEIAERSLPSLLTETFVLSPY